MFDCHMLSVKGPDALDNDDYAIADPTIGVFVVADGMGGRPAGARASSVAVSTFVTAVKEVDDSHRMDLSVLQAAIARANRCIQEVSNSDPMVSGLGTTLSAAILNGYKGKVVHVGDSRIYLYRDQTLVQLTRDHTLTAELVERRHISIEGAKRHPLRHMLSRSLGTADEVHPDIDDLRLRLGDRLILATDGLTKSLDTADLNRVICESAQKDAEEMCRAIMDAALEKAATDDITTLVVHFREDTE